jgi:hypothetical protein
MSIEKEESQLERGGFAFPGDDLHPPQRDRTFDKRRGTNLPACERDGFNQIWGYVIFIHKEYLIRIIIRRPGGDVSSHIKVMFCHIRR